MPPCEQCEDYILWWYQNTGLLRKRPPCPLCEPDDDGSADESGLGDNKVLGDNQGGEHKGSEREGLGDSKDGECKGLGDNKDGERKGLGDNKDSEREGLGDNVVAATELTEAELEAMIE